MNSSRLPGTQVALPISPYIFELPERVAQPGARAATTAAPDSKSEITSVDAHRAHSLRVSSAAVTNFGAMSTGTFASRSITCWTCGRITTMRSSSCFTPA